MGQVKYVLGFVLCFLYIQLSFILCTRMKLPTDPIILELLPEFLDDWNQQLEANFMSYVNAHDEHEVYRIGHTLKGSCYQFGLDDIAQMGITLMTHARAHDWANAQAMYEPIKNAFLSATEEVKIKLNL